MLSSEEIIHGHPVGNELEKAAFEAGMYRGFWVVNEVPNFADASAARAGDVPRRPPAEIGGTFLLWLMRSGLIGVVLMDLRPLRRWSASCPLSAMSRLIERPYGLHCPGAAAARRRDRAEHARNFHRRDLPFCIGW